MASYLITTHLNDDFVDLILVDCAAKTLERTIRDWLDPLDGQTDGARHFEDFTILFDGHVISSLRCDPFHGLGGVLDRAAFGKFKAGLDSPVHRVSQEEGNVAARYRGVTSDHVTAADQFAHAQIVAFPPGES